MKDGKSKRVYEMVVRPVVIYGLETAAITKGQVVMLEVE